ncbi:MAG TPA: hypothetical protein VHU87_10825 [Rhizomicrobium sp.]|jgi:hypothetical protein|nr:hypothetical protein [Rhizomicrobium sp.]
MRVFRFFPAIFVLLNGVIGIEYRHYHGQAALKAALPELTAVLLFLGIAVIGLMLVLQKRKHSSN